MIIRCNSVTYSGPYSCFWKGFWVSPWGGFTSRNVIRHSRSYRINFAWCSCWGTDWGWSIWNKRS